MMKGLPGIGVAAEAAPTRQTDAEAAPTRQTDAEAAPTRQTNLVKQILDSFVIPTEFSHDLFRICAKLRRMVP